MRGKGKTVFSGSRIEEFDVEILGVLQNAGPRQSIILGRLSGGPLAQSGILQGMSGSPVYISGRLVGAVALSYQFAKEPIAGIRPIEEMVAERRVSPRAASFEALAASREEVQAGSGRLVNIATPVSFSGFTQRTIDAFAPQLRALGLTPLQGALGGASASPPRTAPPRIEPGSMISVQLITGDLTVGADGTVTHIDRERIWAFGHRFLSGGSVEMPFARSEVLTVLPNVSTSFKISAAREWLGTITSDHNTAIAGELGRRGEMTPVSIEVDGQRPYRMRLVLDRLLTPFLLQMATYAALDATERLSGAATVSMDGTIEFESGPSVRVENIYSAETNVPMAASLGASIPLSYAMQSGFPQFKPKAVHLRLKVAEERRQLQVDQIVPSRTRVRPGEAFEVSVLLTGPGGVERRHKASYRVPPGAPPGPLQITVSEAMATNLAEFAHVLTTPPASAARVIEVLNNLRSNQVATLRISRTEPSFVVQGQTLPDPPASLALLLRKSPGMAAAGASSKVAQFDFREPGWVIAGSRTAQVEIKE